MVKKQLLNDKLTAAKLPWDCLMRQKLVERFNREAEKRVIFVSAPAGYGKTVSTQLWLSRKQMETLWIGLDRYDNTPSVFCKLFCRGVLSLQPENTAMSKILDSPSFSSSPVEHTIRLLSEFLPDDRQYVLVLDDMHAITNRELLKSLLLVRKRLPLSFLTMILTRNEINEEYKSSIGDGRYAVVTSEDLVFSVDEIQRYFNDRARFISNDDAARIYSITAGWAMGVKVIALSERIEYGYSSIQILGNYIKKHVWDNWDEELRMFMVQTAVVDELPVELCEQLTGRSDSREMLEMLLVANTFISRLSDDTYCYHHLFLDFLRLQADEYRVDTKSICKKAAEYYIACSQYFTARHYAYQSEDIELILRVIFFLSQYGNSTLDEFVNFIKMHTGETLLESICDRAPCLYATLMWENYLLGNSVKMEYFMDKIYQFLPAIAIDSPREMETLMMQATLDHRIPLSLMAERFNDLPPVTYMHQGQQGATLTHEFPFLHRSNRDYYELADNAVREGLSTVLGRFFKEDRDLIILSIESGLLLEQSNFAEALSTARRAYKLINDNTSCELKFCALVNLTAAFYALNNPEYKAMLLEIERCTEKTDSHNLHANYMALKTKILLLNGDKKAAADWLDNYFVTDNEPLMLYKIYQHFATAKSYAVLGRTEEALCYVSKLKQLAAGFRRPLDIAEACVLQAILEWSSGKKLEAQHTLEEVMKDMQPHGFSRVIAIEGSAVLPVLKRLCAKIKKPDYNSQLQAQYVHKVALAAYEQSRRYKGISVYMETQPVKLSKQQKRILSLLSKGFKYTEIMENTGLTIHTVKSHASAVYRKLGVNNSMDAAVRAREFGLIE